MKSLVLPVRKGGLGNQMFQVAAAIVYSIETGRDILLPKEMTHIHNRFKQEYADTIFRFIKTRLESVIDANAIEVLKRNGWNAHPGEPGFEVWKPERGAQGNIILHGYFQSYPPLMPHERSIRSFFLEGLAKLNVKKDAVGIHVRRGDYLKLPHSDVHFIQGAEYYEAAIEAAKKNLDVTQYHIFSDDIEWCKQQLFFSSLPSVEFVDEPDECTCLARMVECHGGFICANSTFSWWGAFLGAHSVGAPCIAPSRWFKGADIHLFPNTWIVIPA
jgi:hypothetical protein